MPDEASDTGGTAPDTVPPVPPTTRRPARTLVATTAAAVALVIVSFVTVVLCAGRGLDLTDEGFYLLSYRWWNDNYDNFTGAQYFMGPVFELLGFDIARFRIFRVGALIVSHAFFGLCFMGWLRTVRPHAPASPLWNVAGAAAITACSPAVYSWLPLSIGYNDVALMCSLGLAGCALWIARDQELDRRVVWWAPFGIGAFAVVLLLSKWSSSLVVLLGLAITLVVLTGTRRRWAVGGAVLIGWIAAGVVAVLGVLQLVLVPPGTLLPPLLEVNRMVAGSTNSPALLLQTYLEGFRLLLSDVLRLHWPLLLVALAAPLLRRVPRIGVAAVVVAVAASVAAAVRTDGLLGGPVHVLEFVPTLYAPVVTALVVAAVVAVQRLRSDRRSEQDGPAGSTPDGRQWSPRLRRWVLLTMVAGMPFAQAAGTGNWVHQLAAIGVGFWMAVLIHLLTGLDRPAVVPRALVGAMAAFLAVSTTVVAVSALWSYPYRTTGHDVSTTAVPELPALSSLRLSPSDAADFTALHDLLEPYLGRPGRPMIAFDRLAGMVLALGGRPVGESWYSATAPDRSRAGIVRTCEGQPWWGPRNRPLVFFNRSVTEADLDALDACGIRVVNSDRGRKNYRATTITFRDAPLYVYLPD